MGGDEGSHLMFFPGLKQMRQGSHAYSSLPLPGFPSQVPLPMMTGACPPTPGPGAYTCARPGYAYAQAHAYAYPPPPPPGPYVYPPHGYPYPHPGSPAPHQGHGSSGHGGAQQMETMESTPKGGRTVAATASATAAYGGISHGSSDGHGGGRQVEVMETAPKSGSAATASASAYGAINNLFRGHGRSGSFGFFGNCCGGHNCGTSSFKHAAGAGHGHQGKFKSGHRPGKVERVHGKFRAKRTTWK